MRRGVDIISLENAENRNGNAYIYGENFNEYSEIYINGSSKSTEYIDRNTLYIEDYDLEAGDSVCVKQVDGSSHILSETNTIFFE